MHPFLSYPIRITLNSFFFTFTSLLALSDQDHICCDSYFNFCFDFSCIYFFFILHIPMLQPPDARNVQTIPLSEAFQLFLSFQISFFLNFSWKIKILIQLGNFDSGWTTVDAGTVVLLSDAARTSPTIDGPCHTDWMGGWATSRTCGRWKKKGKSDSFSFYGGGCQDKQLVITGHWTG